MLKAISKLPKYKKTATNVARSILMVDCGDVLLSSMRVMTANESSSATRRTGRHDCNRDAPAGFAAAH